MKFKLPWTICRVCLQEGQMHSIFLKDTVGMTIAEKLNIVADIKVVPDKKLPEEICRRCMILLNSAFQFQVKCKKAEFLLQMAIKHKQQLNQGKKESALILTLSNGKIYTMPKDVTLKKKSATFNTSSKVYTDSSSRQIDEHKAHVDNSIFEKNASSPIVIESQNNKHKEDAPLNSDSFDTNSNISTIELNDTNSTKTNPNRNFKSRQAKNMKRKKPTKREIQCKRFQAPNMTKLFICELCGNRYKSKVGFDVHLRIHRNERPYKCEICSASFVQSSKLTTHMRRHTGERPYQCSFCSRRFLKKEAKLIHERMHTGEKPYECTVCKKTFSYLSVLARHKVLHSNEEKNFECIPCGKRFRFKYHLVAHLKTSSHQTTS